MNCLKKIQKFNKIMKFEHFNAFAIQMSVKIYVFLHFYFKIFSILKKNP